MPQARAALLAWFDQNKRDLPWRCTQDPYAIWLSEVMLQQTRVETVIPYYERFLEAFPTVNALANAPRERVLAAWAGLGYYRRARMLHDAAMQITSLATFPNSAKSLLEIHGIGPYTAGAVASIAFGEVTPLVDGNVQRVLARLCDMDGDMRAAVGAKQAWAMAAKLVDVQRPGDWNQALMELGARVCTPTSPLCVVCPVQSACESLAGDFVALRPVMSPKKRPLQEQASAYVLRDGDAVWLGRRREHLRFGGLWEPPAGSASGTETGCTPGAERWVYAGELKHVLTHRILLVQVYTGDQQQGASWTFPRASDYDEIRRVPIVSLAGAEIGLSTLAKKVLAMAGIDARPVRARTRGLNAEAARD